MQSVKRRPGPGCGSDHELLITKFRLKLKKVGKTIRPFSWPNQISYDYTVEVMNRFKRFDLVDGVPGELWMEIGNIVAFWKGFKLGIYLVELEVSRLSTSWVCFCNLCLWENLFVSSKVFEFH